MITLKTENISCVPEGSLCFFPGNTPTGNHWLSCYHHWLVLPLLQLHEMNPKWTLSWNLFCVLFLPFNIMSLRFIHVVAGNNLLCFIEELIFHHYEHCQTLFIHSLVGCLGCFQFGSTVNKVGMDILEYIFWRSFALISFAYILWCGNAGP